MPSIPLYLAAGPSFEVYTDNAATVDWLTKTLLRHGDLKPHCDSFGEPWWSYPSRQSDHGVLLGIESDVTGRDVGSHVTEVLIYAAATEMAKRMPTPPASSSPAPFSEDIPKHHVVEEPEVKVYAVPLCSNIIRQAENISGMCSPPLEDNTLSHEARFLPHSLERHQGAHTGPQKRLKIASLFEDATQQRRMLKGRGGERISKAMSSIDRPPSQNGLPKVSHGEEREIVPLQRSKEARGGLSRASSTTSLASSEYPRPASRSGALANGKRSSLHRVESAISPRDSPTLSDLDSSLCQQNKIALTRVIMAGMRLHGLQQKKKTFKAQENREPATIAVEADDEYKVVYHQTLKAATFTFRKYLDNQVIPQEALRDVVDRLLAIFCTDPMKVDNFGENDMQAFGGSQQGHNSSFDKPSTGVLPFAANNASSTPCVKKL